MKYILYYCLFIVIILCFSYINSLPSTESFTPYINGIVRPRVRDMRIIGEGFYSKSSSHISNLFRKFGLL